jgi:hypothetical protein
MRKIFSASVGKYLASEKLNEDSLHSNNLRGIYAISDGASDSYNSSRWSSILVRRFVQRPCFDAKWLNCSIQRYAEQFNREKMSWSAQAAFDRGSFATLTGIVIAPYSARAHVLGFGDSIALLVDGNDLIESFPYDRAEQFAQDPLLLSTKFENNRDILSQAPFRSVWRSWGLHKYRRPTIVCMTDALGAWLLRSPSERLQRLLALKTKHQFSGLIERERSTRRMRRDDATLLIIR